ncbi:FAD-dependent oxidoreductase [Thermovenabulum gondwanense]|uniref:Uncharacterized protein n=1 Tax=Thermovenabulum gondwanense TaxID=520767 RepID=A0A162ML02_9FIRM|nr:FAD-dependent oxidoreductase [Thermovenabulum gondwanense]KYO66526.1 hypothetical protein ATZ99_11540 [Thermovenabulum gondwanense]
MINLNKLLKTLLIVSIVIIIFISNTPVASERVIPQKYYQVVVVGAEPEGIAAAVSAARNGLRTLLIDRRDKVGGLYTLGWLNSLDLNYKSKNTKEIVNKGIFGEFHRKVGGGSAFDILQVQKVFNDMLKNSGVDVVLTVSDIKPIVKDNKIKGISFGKNGINYLVNTSIVIDSTQNADIAAASGVPYKFGWEDFGFPGEVAAATLVFSVKNVDWNKVVSYLQKDGNPYTGGNNTSAWGYEVMYKTPIKDPDIQMRGINAGRQKDGTVVINALQIFNVNPLDENEKKRAIERAKRELPGIIDFMRKNAPGFENAELAGVAQELYIRESRHIIGEYTLTADDIFENRNQEIAVAFGSYPIDLQARKKGMTGIALCGTNPYGIPFGVMVPKNIDGLLIASHCASYDVIAHGSARTVPVGMALGQAAGVASKLAIEKNVTFREIARSNKLINELRTRLEKQGVDLKPIKVDNPEKNSWAYPYIKSLRNKAMLSKGYSNDYRLEDTATIYTFSGVFFLINSHSQIKIDTTILKNYDKNYPVKKTDYIEMLNKILSSNYRNWEELLKEGLVDEKIYTRIIKSNDYLTNSEAYALIDCLVKYIQNR